MEPSKTDIPPNPSIRPPAQLGRKRPTAQLTGIQFGLLSKKETVQLSVIGRRTTEHSRGLTKWQDLFDPRLGIPNKEGECETCKGTRRGGCERPSSCDGHFGHISLPLPIYHPHFVRKCRNLLSSVCLGCSRVLAKKKRKNVLEAIFEDESPNSASKKPARKRKDGPSAGTGGAQKRKRSEKGCNVPSLPLFFGDELDTLSLKQECLSPYRENVPYTVPPQGQKCKQEPVEIDDSSLPGRLPQIPSEADQPGFCKYCLGPDGVVGSKLPKVKLKVASKVFGRKGRIDTIKLEVDEKAGVLPAGFWDFVNGHPTNFNEKTRTLLPAEALKILRRIRQEDIPKLHMDKIFSRPEAFIMRETLVTPNCNRLIMEDWSSTTQPKLLMRRSRQNSKLEALVKKVKQVKDGSSGKTDFADAEQDCGELQLLTARHFRSCKVVEFKMKTGQEIEETGGSFELKWLKANVLAKRSNYSARTVINGDPCIRIGEIGIPKEVAQRLTVEEKVNNLNIRIWQKFIDDYMVAGKKSLPGAFLLNQRKGQRRDLEVLREMMQGKDQHTLNLKLELGDTIIRCLKDGDRVFANRPPSLHKHSLIALKVKVHPLLTFAVNPLICPPFDADFDGDAFHIFVPQSWESMAELQELMSVTQQMICPQGGQPLIGLTQDSLVGGHLLTKSHIFINKQDMNQLSMWCSSKIPVPAIVKSPQANGPLWTGKQLFSMTLPNGLNFGNLSWTGRLLNATQPPGQYYNHDGEVLIQDGEVLICEGGAKWLDRSQNGIVRAVCNHAGPVAAVEHLNCLQAVLHQWLLIRGFSVGLLDYYAGVNANARSRMLEGIQKSLQRANEASLKQALRLDRLLQRRIFSPKSHGDIDMEHQGCFGLLLEDCKSSQRVTALQGVAVERFQSLTPVIENLITGYMDKQNSLLAMVRSGSKGSMSKLTQQVGCLGLQLYKGEKMLPLCSNNKLSYFQTALERGRSEVFYPTKTDTRQVGYWESRGIISRSYLDGLNPVEFFLDSVASRCNVMRQGIEEPNKILKNLMLFMRDMHIAYDGTVRNRSGQRIIQFQYVGSKECLAKDPNLILPEHVSLNSSQRNEDYAERWGDSKLAGEPVGVLAATAIAEPAYNVKMQSIHQTQLLGTGPVQLLKETLLARFKSKLKLNDRRSILRLPSGFGKEQRALKVQNELQRFTLEMITLTSAIEFWRLDDKVYVKTETDKDGPSPNIFLRMSPWMGHLLLCKRSVVERKLNIHSIVVLLNKKYSGKTGDDSHNIYFSYSDNCCSKVHPSETRGMCIWFFPLVPTENVAAVSQEVNRETMALLLESMKTIMLPAILNTTIKGSDDIERVRIFWEDSGSASRLPSVGSIGQPSLYKSRRSDPGELVVEVVVKAKKGAGKRGAAWLAVKEACIPVMDLIDWRRSSPYSIQEMHQCYGLEAAHQNIIKRLTLATKNMGKPVLQEHLILVADTMTHSGDVIGLGSAGYREFCQSLSILTPFTEAAFQEPKKTFLNAGARGDFDNLVGVLPSAVWGTRIPVGTGTEFKLTSQVPILKAKGQTLPIDPLKLWDQLRVPAGARRKRRSVLTAHKDSHVERMNRKSPCQPREQSPESIAVTAKSVESSSLGNSNPSSDRIEEVSHPEELVIGEKESVTTPDENMGTCTTSPPVATESAGILMKQTGCKHTMERVEDENECSDERATKVLKQSVGFGSHLMGGDPVILRVNDPHRVSWSISGHDAVVAKALKAISNENRDEFCKWSDFSGKVVPQENYGLRSADSPVNVGYRESATIVYAKSDSGFSIDKQVETTDAVPCAPLSEKEETRSSSNTRSVWYRLQKIRSFFSSRGGEESRDVSSSQIDPVDDNQMAKGNSGTDRDVAQLPPRLLGELSDHQNGYLTCPSGSVGPSQLEADNEVEQGIIDEKKELQNLLQLRYRAGERVQGDVEKMLLEEVLVHHPKRAEKVGCGVDYLKVDYHPQYTTTKCFHIVRKDGSISDFSIHKCLDSKRLKLYSLKRV